MLLFLYIYRHQLGFYISCLLLLLECLYCHRGHGRVVFTLFFNYFFLSFFTTTGLYVNIKVADYF